MAEQDTKQITRLEQLQGTYRGFAPTDESNIGLGELEISITQTFMKTRHAAGLRIDEEETPISEFKPMTRDELSGVYREGSPYINRSVGFSIDEMKFVFLPDATDEEMGLLIRGNEMADMLAPTFLYNPEQIARGVYQKVIESIEANAGKDCFPTLANGGLIKR